MNRPSSSRITSLERLEPVLLYNENFEHAVANVFAHSEAGSADGFLEPRCIGWLKISVVRDHHPRQLRGVMVSGSGASVTCKKRNCLQFRT